MSSERIAFQRLLQQGLSQPRFKTPVEVVGWFGAVQAQEYALAKWGVAQRTTGITDDDVERAFADGAILRTHVMRPTWHFVTADDIRWILTLTAPRVHALNAYMYRKLELNDALLVRSSDALAKALEGGKHLTRAELAAALKHAGIDAATTMRLGYLVHYAELEAVLCSGARRGKQHTYTLLSERAPHARVLARDEALAELTRRFFTGHGHATMKDFAWWSGLTMADAKTGLAMNQAHLAQTVIDGTTYWHAKSLPTVPTQPISPTAYLLPPYDEYAIAFRDHRAILDPVYIAQAKSSIFGGIIVIDSQVVGNWKRTLDKNVAVIEFAPFRPFTDTEHDAVMAAVRRYSEFLQMPARVV